MPKRGKIKALFFAAALFGAGQAQAAPGTLSSCSGTVAGTSAAITFTNRPQAYVQVHNPNAANVLWVNPVGGAAAANTAGSASLNPGGYLWFDGPVQPGAINIIAPAGSSPYTCWYR